MSMNVTSGYARPLECHELDDRFQAEQRLATFADTDDLVALDTLCLQARQLVAEQPIGSPAALCKEMIRDLTICLGDILLRYIRADWAIGIEVLGEGEYSHGRGFCCSTPVAITVHSTLRSTSAGVSLRTPIRPLLNWSKE